MANFVAWIRQGAGADGPYVARVEKDGAPVNDTLSLANPNAALNQVRDDIGGALAGQVIKSITITVEAV